MQWSLLKISYDNYTSTLLQRETTHFSEDPVGHGTGVLVRKSESGTVNCQSGVYQPFSANNLPKNSLVSVRGNRFNI